MVFVGDLHASDNTYASIPGMVGDSKFALSQISDFCRTNSYPLVLLGDTFNNRFPSPSVQQWFFKLISTIDVAFICGQHDMHRDVAVPEIETGSSNLRIRLNDLTNSTLLNGIRIWGFDHVSLTQIESELEHVPLDCDVLCCHQMLKQVAPSIGSWNMDIEQVPTHVRLTVLGDWHGQPDSGVTAGRRWQYTGSMTMRSVSEPVRKSFLVVTKNRNGELSVEKRPLLTRPFLRVELSDADQLERFLASVDDHVAGSCETAILQGMPNDVAIPYVYVVYSTAIDRVASRLASCLDALRSTRKAFIRVVPVMSPEEVAEVSHVASLDEIIDSEVDPTMLPDLNQLVRSLASGDTDEVVKEFLQRRDIVADVTA